MGEMGSEVLLLDGGFSNELHMRCSYDVHKNPLWTARAIHTEPHTVKDTHLAYLKAGADIIETSTFQASIPGFTKFLGITPEESYDLMKLSASLAKETVAEYYSKNMNSGLIRNILVAGSIGPYGAYLADGSEYTGKYIEEVSEETLIDFHAPRIKALVEGGVDLLAVETIPTLKEAKIILNYINTHFPSVKTWISFSVQSGGVKTSYGEPLMEVYKSLDHEKLWGFGINCCHPTDVSKFLSEALPIRLMPNHPKIIVYPNSGHEWVKGKGWIESDVPHLDTYVGEWMELGVDIIGGCCQIDPTDIHFTRNIIDEWNSKEANF